MKHDLKGKHVAILIAPKGTEHVEFAEPKAAVERSGGRVSVVGVRSGEATTVRHDLEPCETVAVDPAAVGFVRGILEKGKPVAAICHDPWVLLEADVVRGRTLTSYPSLQTDVRNAGGTWVDREVQVDQGLVTSRNPDDLPAFTAKLIEEVADSLNQRPRETLDWKSPGEAYAETVAMTD